MNLSGILFIATFVVLLICPFTAMIAKSYYHFEYLKKINPEKFKKYQHYFDTYNKIEFFNKYRVILLFPYFKRHPEIEGKEELSVLVKKILLYRRLTYYSIVAILIYVAILIVLFGDFS